MQNRSRSAKDMASRAMFVLSLSKSQLARVTGVSLDTVSKWLDGFGAPPTRLTRLVQMLDGIDVRLNIRFIEQSDILDLLQAETWDEAAIREALDEIQDRNYKEDILRAKREKRLERLGFD